MNKKLFFFIVFFFLNIICFAQLNNGEQDSSRSSKDIGLQLYQKACNNCHAPQVAIGLGAPPAFDKKVWRAHLKKAEALAKANPQQYKNAYDYLVYQVKRGKGLMHHGGLCRESKLSEQDCSDEAYIAAIKYMSQPSK